MATPWRDFRKEVPSTGRYEAALHALEYELRRRRNAIAMLQAHYHAPHWTLTAQDMARQLGYSSHSSANLQYGKIGTLFCDALASELEFKINVLCDFILPGEAGNKELQWVMWPSLAKALEKTGWVEEQ